MEAGRWNLHQENTTLDALLVAGNDSISSIKMTDGIILIAYSDMDFSGDTKILTSSSRALTDFNDTISSIIVFDTKKAAVFADGYYQGNHQILRPGKYYFKDLTVGNDTISSILMSEGLRMVLYEHDFAGTTKTIKSSTPFLSDFNDVVSSVYLSEQNISEQTSPPRAEKTQFDVILKSAGAGKLGVVARGKELTGLGLKEAKDLVDGAPKPIREGVLKVTAESIKAYLTDAGAEVEVK